MPCCCMAHVQQALTCTRIADEAEVQARTDTAERLNDLSKVLHASTWALEMQAPYEPAMQADPDSARHAQPV